MRLKFYHHPLASFCHKVLIALYEKNISFEPLFVDPGDAASAEAFRKVSPMGKMPVLIDEERGRTVGETTIILAYLERHFPQPPLVPADPDLAEQPWYWDRFYDFYVHLPMQAIVADRLRQEEKRDAFGVEQWRSQLRSAYGEINAVMSGREWAAGPNFTVADCSAAPALFYADTIEPIGAELTHLRAYRRRLMLRPSQARVLREAAPYFGSFPLDPKPDISMLDEVAA